MLFVSIQDLIPMDERMDLSEATVEVNWSTPQAKDKELSRRSYKKSKKLKI